MQLGKFLEKGGAERVNVVAISWSEGLYGNPSEKRLFQMVRTFHPSIRVVRSDDKLEKDFAPLNYVPMNFLFAPDGRHVYGDGSRNPLEIAELEHLLDETK